MKSCINWWDQLVLSEGMWFVLRHSLFIHYPRALIFQCFAEKSPLNVLRGSERRCFYFSVKKYEVGFTNLESSEFCNPELRCYMSIVQFEGDTKASDFQIINQFIKKFIQAHLVSHSLCIAVQLYFTALNVMLTRWPNTLPFHFISKLPRPARHVLPGT